MKKCLFIVFLFLLNHGFTQSSKPPELKKVIAFIFADDGNQKIVPYGTGFYVSVLKDSSVYRYLVTAKHVLKKQDGKFLDNIYVRVLKRTDSTFETIRIPLYSDGIKRNVFLHTDSTVDIAVISVAPDPTKYDLSFLPSDMLTTKESFDSLNITEGDEVFFTGMFSPYLGEKANYPITRFGRVALVTNERVFWNNEWKNLYLLEATTYWGNSGSPVYFSLTREPKPRPNTIYLRPLRLTRLAGIMSGFFGADIPGKLVQTNLVPYNIINLGISAVTPSYLLYEILFSDEMIRRRK